MSAHGSNLHGVSATSPFPHGASGLGPAPGLQHHTPVSLVTTPPLAVAGPLPTASLTGPSFSLPPGFGTVPTPSGVPSGPSPSGGHAGPTSIAMDVDLDAEVAPPKSAPGSSKKRAADSEPQDASTPTKKTFAVADLDHTDPVQRTVLEEALARSEAGPGRTVIEHTSPGLNDDGIAALCKLIDRTSWASELNGQHIPRKANGVDVDLRHIIAYETMQKALKSVLEASSTASGLDGGLRSLAPRLLDANAVAALHNPLTADERTRLVEALNKALFNCRANFFIGDAMMNRRLGSATGAFGKTEEARTELLAQSQTSRALDVTLLKAVNSLAHEAYDSTFHAFESTPTSSRATKTKPNNELLAQGIRKSSPFAPVLERIDRSTEPALWKRTFEAVRRDAIDALESLRDSTGFDVSQAADPGLLALHRQLAPLFTQFRTAERTGAMADFVTAANAMMALETQTQALADAKGITLAQLYAIG